jgi:hypothetical protein
LEQSSEDALWLGEAPGLLTFPSDAAVIREYAAKVRFSRLALEPCTDPAVAAFKIGGLPTWLQGDETPKSSARIAVNFLLQLPQGYTFQDVCG